MSATPLNAALPASTVRTAGTGRCASALRHLLFLICFFGLWEWGSRAGWLDRTLFGQPSEIAHYLWRGFFVRGDLWLELDSGGDAPVLLPTAMAAEAGADPAVEKAQPYQLTLNGKGRDLTLKTRALVRDMVRDGVVGIPALVHWQLTFDLATDRLWIAPTKG